MSRPSKGLTCENTLRTTDTERLTLEREQEWYRENGLKLSLNDVMRSLIRRARIPIPLTKKAATEEVERHSAECSVCVSTEPPRCPDGLYIRQLYAHFLAAPGQALHSPAVTRPPAAKRTVSGRPPLLPPPPGKVQQ